MQLNQTTQTTQTTSTTTTTMKVKIQKGRRYLPGFPVVKVWVGLGKEEWGRGGHHGLGVKGISPGLLLLLLQLWEQDYDSSDCSPFWREPIQVHK